MGENFDKLKGRAKEATGAMTDDDRMRREGKADQTSGKAKGMIDDARDKAHDMVDKARSRTKRD